MTPWETKDPIDRCLGALFRSPRYRQGLAFLLVAAFGIYALALISLPLERLPGLRLLRLPLKLLQSATQTQQNWAMFKEFPYADFDLVVHSGHLSPLTDAFTPAETLGPAVPGFASVNVGQRLRYYLFFQNTMKQGGPEKCRAHFLRNLKSALAQRNRGKENPPTHFVLELSVSPLPNLRETDPASYPPPPTTHRLGPLPIGVP